MGRPHVPPKERRRWRMPEVPDRISRFFSRPGNRPRPDLAPRAASGYSLCSRADGLSALVAGRPGSVVFRERGSGHGLC